MIEELRTYPAHRASDSPWLATMPAHWESRKGKWLFRRMDRPVREQDEVVTCFRDGLVTLRKNRRLRGFTESIQEIGYQGIRRGDLVIHGMDAFAGAIGVSDSDGKGSPVYSVCEASAGVDPRYYAFLLREMARRGWIQALAKGIRERSTDFRYEAFASQLLPVPSESEQAAMVRFLDHVDRRAGRYVRAKQEIIKLLEEQTQAVIQRAITGGLDPNVRLKTSRVEWLGDIPEHWDLRTLGQVANSFRTGPFGSILHQSDYVEGGIPLVNPTHMRGGEIVEDRRASVTPEVADRLSAYRLAKHDLVFSRRGELGRCALVRDREVGWLCGTGSIRVEVEYAALEPEFLIQALQVPGVGEYLSLSSVGSTMANLNTAILKGVPLPIPPLDEQREIVASIRTERRQLDRAIGAARSEIDLTREYRTRLMSDVVTGKLDVGEAAARLPECGMESDPLEEVGALTATVEGVTDDRDGVPEEVTA